MMQPLFETILLVIYFAAIVSFSFFGFYKLFLTTLFLSKRHRLTMVPSAFGKDLPAVTVQCPVYNEPAVIERLIDCVAGLQYPKLHIQILDDSNDETATLARTRIHYWQQQGVSICHIQRQERRGFKAGALAYGLVRTKDPYIAIFDADFLPMPDFLTSIMPSFNHESIAMVQARWVFLNSDENILTRLQTIFLNGHFIVEHAARYLSGAFFNFNGTAGVWRRDAIIDAGNWQGDTLTEDMDLSYRAQLRGWKFVYRPDVVVPSELPRDLGAVRTQQFRWVKGMCQVARKLIKPIWQSRISLFKKIESTFHLFSCLGYLTSAVMATVVIPVLIWHEALFRSWSILFAAFFLFSNLVVIVLFYGVGTAFASGLSGRRCWDIICLLPFAIAMSLQACKAIFEGWIGIKSPFVRTPKRGLLGSQSEPSRFHNAANDSLKIEQFYGLYYVFHLLWIVTTGNIYFLPAWFFFGSGFVALNIWAWRFYGDRANNLATWRSVFAYPFRKR